MVADGLAECRCGCGFFARLGGEGLREASLEMIEDRTTYDTSYSSHGAGVWPRQMHGMPL